VWHYAFPFAGFALSIAISDTGTIMEAIISPTNAMIDISSKMIHLY